VWLGMQRMGHQDRAVSCFRGVSGPWEGQLHFGPVETEDPVVGVVGEGFCAAWLRVGLEGAQDPLAAREGPREVLVPRSSGGAGSCER
jgi:hypothetical protein